MEGIGFLFFGIIGVVVLAALAFLVYYKRRMSGIGRHRNKFDTAVVVTVPTEDGVFEQMVGRTKRPCSTCGFHLSECTCERPLFDNARLDASIIAMHDAGKTNLRIGNLTVDATTGGGKPTLVIIEPHSARVDLLDPSPEHVQQVHAYLYEVGLLKKAERERRRLKNKAARKKKSARRKSGAAPKMRDRASTKVDRSMCHKKRYKICDECSGAGVQYTTYKIYRSCDECFGAGKVLA